MSANYHVKVQSKEADCITFEIYLADDITGWFSDPEFALRLLCSHDDMYQYDDQYEQVANCPLAEEISLDNYLDEEWIFDHTKRFIKDVKLVSVNNFPFETWDYERWYDCMLDTQENLDQLPEDYPGGVISVKVFDPKHLDHLKPGMIFDTVAYSTQSIRQIHLDSIGIWLYSE